MHENNWLAERFEESRAHLLAVAYRMLGSRSEADDAVQEAWLRLSRSDARGIGNLGGWLTSSTCPLTRSRRLWAAHHLRHDSLPAAPAAA